MKLASDIYSVLPSCLPACLPAFFTMFYSQFILSKNGPLASIWIAAHLQRKLPKNHISETSITSIALPQSFTPENAAQDCDRFEFEHHVTDSDLIFLQQPVDDPGNLDVDKSSSAVPILNEAFKSQANAQAVGPSPQEFDTGIPTLNRDRCMEIPEVEKLWAANEHNPFFEFEAQTKDRDDGRYSEVGGENQALEETPILWEEISYVKRREFAQMSPEVALEGRNILGTILGGTTAQLEVMPTPMTARRKRKKVLMT